MIYRLALLKAQVRTKYVCTSDHSSVYVRSEYRQYCYLFTACPFTFFTQSLSLRHLRSSYLRPLQGTGDFCSSSSSSSAIFNDCPTSLHGYVSVLPSFDFCAKMNPINPLCEYDVYLSIVVFLFGSM